MLTFFKTIMVKHSCVNWSYKLAVIFVSNIVHLIFFFFFFVQPYCTLQKVLNKISWTSKYPIMQLLWKYLFHIRKFFPSHKSLKYCQCTTVEHWKWQLLKIKAFNREGFNSPYVEKLDQPIVKVAYLGRVPYFYY